MIPGEEFYPDLQKLVSLPEWASFEKFIDWKIKEVFEQFLVADKSELLVGIQAQASAYFSMRRMVRDLIKEVEESHKTNRR